MPYFMLIEMDNGDTLRSPRFIAPNNPDHDYDHPSIVSEIRKTGESMMKRVEGVKGFKALYT